MFVYFLSYNFGASSKVTAAGENYEDQAQNLNDYDFILQTESREPIRKIADSNLAGSKTFFPSKPKLRKPTNVQVEAQNLTK